MNKGDRVRLIRINDPWSRTPKGTEGTVSLVDDMGTVHVRWDDGSAIGLIAEDGDLWEIIKEAQNDSLYS